MGIMNSFNVTDRITIVDKIESYPFSLPDNMPFTIFIMAKDSAAILCKGILYQTSSSVEFPIMTNIWNPVLVRQLTEVPSGEYSVYYGAAYAE